jgi:type IV pilus assembly protein PilW
MSRRAERRTTRKTTAKGFTLVELMVSMVLGLVVIGAVVSVLLSNKRTFNTTSALSQVQESARTAFELLARDLRQAGATGCDNSGRVANVLAPTGSAWWQNWTGLVGFDGTDVDSAVSIGTGADTRVTGTDSIQIQGIVGNGLSVLSHDVPGAEFTINATSTDLVAGDVLMVCDFDHASIFRASSYDATNVRVAYAVYSGTPGNCSTGLGFPTDCATANVYPFAKNSQISHLSAVDWYIGNNGRPAEGGRSLYRARLTSGGIVATEEIVAGVTNMAIQYRVDGTDSFVDASSVTTANWPKVNAIFITLTIDSADQRVSSDASVNSGRLRRPFTWMITLRNRVP